MKTKINLAMFDKKKFKLLPVGTYVLKSTHSRLLKHNQHLVKEVERLAMDSKADYWQDKFNGVAQDVKEGIRVLDKLQAQYKEKTDRLNQLSKEYNNLVAENKGLKEEIEMTDATIGLMNQDWGRLTKEKASLNSENSSLKSRLFWLWIVATITTATTLLFVGYHIYKTL